ncbi:MAG: hypothetical protein V2A53_02000 [bacterium]
MTTIPVLEISSVKKKGRSKKDPIKEKDLQRFELVHKFIPLLERFHLVRDHHNRELHLNQYISLILFYFLFSFLSSLRGIQQVSHLDKVKKMLGVKGTSTRLPF